MTEEKSCMDYEMGKRCYTDGCTEAIGELGAYCPKADYCGAYEPPSTPQERVAHPPYYQGKYECIELMRAMFGDDAVIGFCKCNSFKYRFRAGRKTGQTAAEDIAKAEWYEDYIMILLRSRE